MVSSASMPVRDLPAPSRNHSTVPDALPQRAGHQRSPGEQTEVPGGTPQGAFSKREGGLAWLDRWGQQALQLQPTGWTQGGSPPPCIGSPASDTEKLTEATGSSGGRPRVSTRLAPRLHRASGRPGPLGLAADPRGRSRRLGGARPALACWRVHRGRARERGGRGGGRGVGGGGQPPVWALLTATRAARRALPVAGPRTASSRGGSEASAGHPPVSRGSCGAARAAATCSEAPCLPVSLSPGASPAQPPAAAAPAPPAAPGPPPGEAHPGRRPPPGAPAVPGGRRTHHQGGGGRRGRGWGTEQQGEGGDRFWKISRPSDSPLTCLRCSPLRPAPLPSSPPGLVPGTRRPVCRGQGSTWGRARVRGGGAAARGACACWEASAGSGAWSPARGETVSGTRALGGHRAGAPLGKGGVGWEQARAEVGGRLGTAGGWALTSVTHTLKNLIV